MTNRLRSVFMAVTILALAGRSIDAQKSSPNVVGDWQGTLPAGKGLRLVLQIAAADSAGGHATLYSIDQSPDGVPIASLTLQGSNLKLTVPAIGGAYEGTVSADGRSIQGAWTQGKNSWLLVFQRATKETIM